MKDTTRKFFETYDFDPDAVTDFALNFVEAFEKYDLLKHTEILSANPYVGLSFLQLIDAKPYQFVRDFSFAVQYEINVSFCINMEWFSTLGDFTSNVVSNGKADPQVINSLVATKYNNLPPFDIYNPLNEDYKEPGQNLAKRYLFNLHEFCGLPDLFIESFFKTEPQDFFKLITGTVTANSVKDFPGIISLYKEILHPNINFDGIISEEEFNEAVIAQPEIFLHFVKYLLEHFNNLRICTLSIIESHMEPVHITNKVVLKGPDAILSTGYNDLKGLLADMLKRDEALTPEAKTGISNFLNKDFTDSTETGGFVGLAKRQQDFSTKVGPAGQMPIYTVGKQEILSVIVKLLNTDHEDLALLNWFKFVISSRHLLKPVEYPMFLEKLISILGSNNPTYFSDIFELYYYFVIKNSDVETELLVSQVKVGGNADSTCDYKLGHSMTADCKCIISHNAKMFKISEWLNKIGSQVKNTLKIDGLDFGGGIIGIRDKGFEFLSSLKNFQGVDNYNREERELVLKFIFEVYSEYRRHTKTNKDQVKFIVIYYIPNLDVTEEVARTRTEATSQHSNEIMMLLTTKYATENEIEVVKSVFSPVSNYIFKFNNTLTL
jgi:hypothetical protein